MRRLIRLLDRLLSKHGKEISTMQDRDVWAKLELPRDEVVEVP